MLSTTNQYTMKAILMIMHTHFKSGVAADPCFKMIGAGVGIYIGDESNGCSLCLGEFVMVCDS
jgi:hypothetical protein